MADVKQINGYNIKDETARTTLANFMNKWSLSNAMANAAVNWIGTDGQQRLEFVFTFNDPNTKLLLQFRYDGSFGFYVTNDGGHSWQNIWIK